MAWYNKVTHELQSEKPMKNIVDHEYWLSLCGDWEQVDDGFRPHVPILSIDEKIILIEEKYEEKFDAQLKLIMKTIASDGVNQEAKITIFQNEYNEIANQKDLEIIELLGGI